MLPISILFQVYLVREELATGVSRRKPSGDFSNL